MSIIDPPALTQAQGDERYAAANRTVYGEVPDGLEWPFNIWPVVPQGSVGIYGDILYSSGLNPEELGPFLGWRDWQRFYVDLAKPDDSGDGLSPATAVRTAAVAQAKLNATGVRGSIWCAGYTGNSTAANRNRNFSAGGMQPTVDTVFVPYNGRVIMTTAETDALFTEDGTGNDTYEVTRSNIARVFDIRKRDADGLYVELQKLSSKTKVRRTPGSWCQIGATASIHLEDGSIVSYDNVRVYLSVDNLATRGTSQVNILVARDKEGDGFDFEGGVSGNFRCQYTGADPASFKVHAFTKGHTFNYCGTYEGSVGAIASEGLYGLTHVEMPIMNMSVTDLLNIHDLRTGGARGKCFWIAVEPQGYGAGNQKITSISNFTATINNGTPGVAGNILTVTGNPTTPIMCGQTVSASGMTTASIVDVGTGTGGAGTYVLGGPAQNISSRTMVTNTYVSCNIVTSHDGATGILVGGRGRNAAGVSFHTIDNSRTYAFGCDFSGSIGDRHRGGGNYPTEVKAEDNAIIWLENPTIVGKPYAVRAEGNSNIFVRNPSKIQGLIYVGPTANYGSY